jgi:uncharacterized protein YodC (DUF2158 family)
MNDQEKPYERGAIVRLKSGGPAMTVLKEYEDRSKGLPTESRVMVRCGWFDNRGCDHVNEFERAVLVTAIAPVYCKCGGKTLECVGADGGVFLKCISCNKVVQDNSNE